MAPVSHSLCLSAATPVHVLSFLDILDMCHFFSAFLLVIIWFSWEKKIPLVRGDLEKTWLFHEIGWCYLELGRYEDARDYGARSAAAASQTADKKWQINANVLAAQSECTVKFLCIFTSNIFFITRISVV